VIGSHLKASIAAAVGPRNQSRDWRDLFPRLRELLPSRGELNVSDAILPN
jgi:hypothetical protein